MQEQDYPALFKSADALSLKAQRQFFGILKTNLVLLVVAAMLSMIPVSHWIVPFLQALVLFAALGSSVYLATRRPDRDWYAGRAVAESVKTTTWRYITRAEPFDGDDEKARQAFLKRLQSIVKHNEQTAIALTSGSKESQITQEMKSIRAMHLDERRRFYATARISAQREWYSRKSAANARLASRFFVALIIVNSAAVVFAVLRMQFVSAAYWPTDVLVAAAASLLGWIQARRYTELSASYSLTAHEIGFILEDSGLPLSESEFSRYVGDVESAFSREHTQWIARVDR